jgi:hypothetical protein
MRAVQASDYAIGEFKILRRLLMFHGRTNNIRISNMILYFFFKNFVFTIPQFYYAFYNNISGQTVYDDWFITLYNLIFTSLPLGAVALFDHDIKPDDGDIAYKLMPFLYLENRKNPRFSTFSFSIELLKGIILGLINYFVSLYSLKSAAIDSSGNMADLWYLSVSLYTNLIFIVSFRLLITQKYITWLSILTMIFTSWSAYFLFISFVNNNNYFNSAGTMRIALTSSRFILNAFLIIGTEAIIDYLFMTYGTLFRNLLRNKLRKEIKKSKNYLLNIENLENMDQEIIDKYNIINKNNNFYYEHKEEQQNEFIKEEKMIIIENGMNESQKKENGIDLINPQRIKVIKNKEQNIFKKLESYKSNEYNEKKNINKKNLSEDISFNKR